MRRAARLWLSVLAGVGLPCAALGQSCSITSPTSGALIHTASPVPLTATVSAAPSAYKLIWSVDYQRWASGFAERDPGMVDDFRDAWQGPWAVTWYSGLNGDGVHTVSGVVYDIFGNALATCPSVSITVRVEGMSNQSISALPNLRGGLSNNSLSVVHTAQVQNITGSNVASISTSNSWTSSSGNLEVCGIRTTNQITASVSNAAGQPFTSFSLYSPGGGIGFWQIWYRQNIIGSTSEAITATFSSPDSYVAMPCVEVHGAAASFPADASADVGSGTLSGAATYTSPPFYAANRSEIIFFGAMTGGSGLLSTQWTTGSIGGSTPSMVCSGTAGSCTAGNPIAMLEYSIESNNNSAQTASVTLNGSYPGVFSVASFH